MPSVTYSGQVALRKHQCRQHDVGVQHDARRTAHFLVLRPGVRAHATAFATSFSVRPSAASFARTASARWIRTGVRMIWPFLASTSKYSAVPTALVMLLGSVSWFLEVTLASMFKCYRKVRNPYFSRTDLLRQAG